MTEGVYITAGYILLQAMTEGVYITAGNDGGYYTAGDDGGKLQNKCETLLEEYEEEITVPRTNTYPVCAVSMHWTYLVSQKIRPS